MTSPGTTAEADWPVVLCGLRNHAVQAALHHITVYSGVGETKADSLAFDLRDSLLFRAQSVGFHLNLLRQQYLVTTDGPVPLVDGIEKVGRKVLENTVRFGF